MNYFLLFVSVLWPLIYKYPANSAIVSFTVCLFDIVNIFLKTKKMVMSEYLLLTGERAPKHWWVSVTFLKTCQTASAWLFVASVHVYSPLYKHIYAVYVCAIVYGATEYAYVNYYKRWVLTYGVLSNDAELTP